MYAQVFKKTCFFIQQIFVIIKFLLCKRYILIHIVINYICNNWYLILKILHQVKLGIWQQQVICETNDTSLVSSERILTKTLSGKQNNFLEQGRLVNDGYCSVCICFKTSYFIFTGAIGYMGTSAFVRKIYTNVKID